MSLKVIIENPPDSGRRYVVAAHHLHAGAPLHDARGRFNAGVEQTLEPGQTWLTTMGEGNVLHVTELALTEGVASDVPTSI